MSCGRAARRTSAPSVKQNFIYHLHPSGVAVDGQHIYWTDFTLRRIGRANLNGTDVEEKFISAGVGNPWGVAVSPG